MTESAAALREPWTSLEDQRRVAMFGMWTFIASEILFFGALFMGFSVVRVLHPAAFAEAAGHTNIWYGSANTAILLTSSFAMVMGLRAADLDLRRLAALCLAVTAVLGLAFLIVKGFEYKDDIDKHLVPGQDFALKAGAAQIFFSFYWGITAVHAVHLTIGIVLVSRLAWLLMRGDIAMRSPQFEVTALYWGFVDIVWITVYPLIYLGGGRS
ncbi:MAG TPA: cytochrome c oxidase subunit 3 [Lichenihabitans sp.]|jgi:cytochrome c oxidase subunit 3|nr:cytochrome c oxidase subunit 3 [Lichenihabitans sp.]